MVRYVKVFYAMLVHPDRRVSSETSLGPRSSVPTISVPLLEEIRSREIYITPGVR
jgi:hypothetical protein